MTREVINTPNAPAAIGPYSQAIKVENVVYLSGQIALVPETMELVGDDIDQQIRQVFDNISAVASACGGSLSEIVKLNVYLTDLSHFSRVNDIMRRYFNETCPARAAVGVSSLPGGAQVEMDGIMVLENV